MFTLNTHCSITASVTYMKPLLFSLLILCFFGTASAQVQLKDKDKEISAQIFALSRAKFQYDYLVARKTTNSVEERKIFAASEFDKSEYSKVLKLLKGDSTRYLTYIKDAITNNADSLVSQKILYEMLPLFSSGDPRSGEISKLDFLKAVKYSLFDQKSDVLLPLANIPGIKRASRY